MSTYAHGKGRGSRHGRHRRSSSRSSHSSSSSSRGSNPVRSNKPSATTKAAKELVASFKTMSFSNKALISRSLQQHQKPKPQQPPPPSSLLPATTTFEEEEEQDDDERAFTLLDCSSVVLGGQQSGGEGRGRGGGSGDWLCIATGCDYQQQQSFRINLTDAMNTVSSSSGGSSHPRQCSHRQRRDRQRQQHQHHHRRPEQRPVQPKPRNQSSRSRGTSKRGASPPRDAQGDARHTAATQSHRRFFGGFERIDDSLATGVEVAAPLATPRPSTEQALVSLQPPGATCWLFQCAELPRPALAAAAAAAASAPLSPQSASAAATATSAASEPHRTQRPNRQQRGQRHCRHRHHAKSQRDLADDQDNDSGKLPSLDRRRHRSRRQRSLRQLAVGDAEAAGGSADDSVVDISVSTIAEDFLGGGVGPSAAAAAAAAASRLRHLLDPPMPTSHRVWVPVGANSGPPPARPQTATSAAAAAASAALEYGNRLTRSAARTARSVSRRLRHAICGGHGERELAASGGPVFESAAGLAFKRDPLPTRQPPAPPYSTDRALCQVRQEIRSAASASNANGNNEKKINRWQRAEDDSEDYSSLLRTLDRARRKQKFQQQQQQQQQLQRSPNPELATSFEFFVDADNSESDSESDSSDSSGDAHSWSSATPSAVGCHRPETNLNRKIDLINSMAESLLGLSQSLKGCVGSINSSLVQMRRA